MRLPVLAGPGAHQQRDALHRPSERTAMNGVSRALAALERAEAARARSSARSSRLTSLAMSRMSGPPGGSRNWPAVSERWTTFPSWSTRMLGGPSSSSRRRWTAAAGAMSGVGARATFGSAGPRNRGVAWSSSGRAFPHRCPGPPAPGKCVALGRLCGRWLPPPSRRAEEEDTGPDAGRNETRRRPAAAARGRGRSAGCGTTRCRAAENGGSRSRLCVANTTHVAHLLRHDVLLAVRAEEALQPLLRHVGGDRLRIAAFASRRQRASSRSDAKTWMLAATGLRGGPPRAAASRANTPPRRWRSPDPDADLAHVAGFGRRTAAESTCSASACPRLRIAEELRDRDQQVREQRVGLAPGAGGGTPDSRPTCPCAGPACRRPTRRSTVPRLYLEKSCPVRACRMREDARRTRLRHR